METQNSKSELPSYGLALGQFLKYSQAKFFVLPDEMINGTRSEKFVSVSCSGKKRLLRNDELFLNVNYIHR